MTVIDNRDEDLRMLRIEQVLDLFPVSRVTLYRLVREKKFPAPEKLGGISLWSNHDLRQWRREMRATGGRTPGQPTSNRRRGGDDLV